MQPSVDRSVVLSEVWIIEDGADVREVVQEIVDEQPDLTCPWAFPSGEAVLEHLNHHRALPRAMLVDIGLPGMSGIDVVEHIRRLSSDTQMVMLTVHDDMDRVFEAICRGASGYLLKPCKSDEIVSALREVLAGGVPMTPQIARKVLSVFRMFKAPAYDYELTEREKEVLRAAVEHRTKKDIGRALFIAQSTVDSHLRNIYAKLRVHSRQEAVAKALREHLV